MHNTNQELPSGEDHQSHYRGKKPEPEQEEKKKKRPMMLDPSPLGDRDYWDTFYASEQAAVQRRSHRLPSPSNPHDTNEELSYSPSDPGSEVNLDSDSSGERESNEGCQTNWFSEHSASKRIISYLSSLSGLNRSTTSFLDLGTGNGHLLFELREKAGFRGRMVGVDYSGKSVELARGVLERKRKRRWTRDGSSGGGGGGGTSSAEGDTDRRQVGEVEEQEEDEREEAAKREKEREEGGGDLYKGMRFEEWDIMKPLNSSSMPEWFYDPCSSERDSSDEIERQDKLRNRGRDGGSREEGTTRQEAEGEDSTTPHSQEEGEEEEGKYNTTHLAPKDEKDEAGKHQERSSDGFDVVLDKGTFDAISLSSTRDAAGRRLCESYASRVVPFMKSGIGILVVTSCNWTEEELVCWFTDPSYHPSAASLSATTTTTITSTASTTTISAGAAGAATSKSRGLRDGSSIDEGIDEEWSENGGQAGIKCKESSIEEVKEGKDEIEEGEGEGSVPLKVLDKIAYPSFTFGGVKGQSLSSVVLIRT